MSLMFTKPWRWGSLRNLNSLCSVENLARFSEDESGFEVNTNVQYVRFTEGSDLSWLFTKKIDARLTEFYFLFHNKNWNAFSELVSC